LGVCSLELVPATRGARTYETSDVLSINAAANIYEWNREIDFVRGGFLHRWHGMSRSPNVINWRI